MNRFAGVNTQIERIKKYKGLYLTFGLYSLVTSLTYLIIYFEYDIWQVWIVPVLGIIVITSVPLIKFFVYHNYFNLAGGLFLFIAALVYGCHGLIWSDLALFQVISGGVIILVVARILIPTRIHYWIIFAGLYILGGFYLTSNRVFPPLSDANVPWIKEFLFAVDSLLILALVAQLLFEIHFRSIRTRLLGVLGLFTLIPVLLIGVITYTFNAQNLQKLTQQNLDSVVIMKLDQIETWQKALLATITALVPHDSESEKVKHELNAQITPLDDTGSNYRAELISTYQVMVNESGLFSEIFMMDLQWKVILSTNPAQIGKIESSRIYFPTDLEDDSFSPLYIDPITEKASQIVAVPVTNEAGQMIAILAGKARMTSLSEILSQEVPFGKSGSLYIVFPNRHLMSSNMETILPEDGESVNSTGIERALSQINGHDVYQNYLGNSVVGAYRWLPDLQVALVAEQSQREALSPASKVGMATLILILTGIIAAFSMATIVSAKITMPLSELSDTTRQIAAGNLSLSIQSSQVDELGDLCMAINAMTIQLRNLVTSLDLKVLERTTDLERQSSLLRKAVEITRDASAYREVDEVLQRTVNLLAEKFGFDFVAIYLINERREFAVLSSVAGIGGKDWETEKRKIRVGSYDPVGITAATGEFRIVTDASIGYNSAFLAGIHARMVLALKVGQQVVGVLDIQSADPEKVNNEIGDVVQVIADQIAIAYDSAQVFKRMRNALRELEILTGQYTRGTWTAVAQDLSQPGVYKFDGISVHPNEESSDLVSNKVAGNSIHLPLSIRDELIGSLDIQLENSTRDPAFEASLREITERLGLLMENSRLVMEARNLAEREKRINQITSQIRGSTNMDAVLRHAVEELAKVFGSSKTYIQLGQLNEIKSDPSSKSNEGEG